MLKVETYRGGLIEFDNEEIQEMLDDPEGFIHADNLPKWLTTALRSNKKKRLSIKATKEKVADILSQVLSGEITYIGFDRDYNGNMIGLSINEPTEWFKQDNQQTPVSEAIDLLRQPLSEGGLKKLIKKWKTQGKDDVAIYMALMGDPYGMSEDEASAAIGGV